MVGLKILLLVLCTASSVSGRQDKIAIIPTNGDIYLGDTSHFLCKVDSGIEATFKWIKPDGEEIEEDTDIYKLNKIDESSAGLYITANDPKQNGQFQCEAEFDGGETSTSSINIRIIQRPKITGESKALQKVSKGNDVMLQCDATGIPQPTIAWLYNDHDVTRLGNNRISVVRNKQLSIQNVQDSDAGIYRCKASILERNEIAFKDITVSVIDVPKIFFDDREPLSTWPGHPIKHSIKVQANPPATVSMSQNGVPVQIREAARNTTTQIFTFTFTPKSKEDFMPLLVQASNEIGTRTREILVREADEPDTPKLSGVTGVKGNTFSLQLEGNETTGLPILQYIARYKPEKEVSWMERNVSSNSNSLVLENLEWNTKYQLEIIAVNEKGLSKPAVHTFTTSDGASLPDAQPISQQQSIGVGGIIGIVMVIFLVLFLVVDVSCYYTKQRGMLMCIAVNLLGKQPPGAKRHELEDSYTRTRKVERSTVVNVSGIEA
ncbi:neural cell adhesion molecule 2 [Microcaecilia unicolor]|uniref:Neural cell adhesion molecule 2-like n=1 Tax=Microcaecilia unicolor TaxID=1415580 RepID=A0A6P7YLW0_9AMPH|nr:neural cell adhesion molecule 2-like [Microcaecilia unicolor]